METKRTPERAQKIVELVKAGNYRATACRASGIGYSTFKEWINDDEEFKSRILEAEAEAEASALLKIQIAATGSKGNPGDWKAAAWYLERRYPDRYGNVQKIEASVQATDDESLIAEAATILARERGEIDQRESTAGNDE